MFATVLSIASQVCTADASVVTAAQPAVPASVSFDSEQHAVVAVKLDPAGRVVAATIALSTGNAQLDDAALQAARQSTYRPAVAGCKTVASTVGYDVSFEPPPCNVAGMLPYDEHHPPRGFPMLAGTVPRMVLVEVTIDQHGKLESISIARSSTMLAQDSAALKAAYDALISKSGCTPGTYLMKFTY